MGREVESLVGEAKKALREDDPEQAESLFRQAWSRSDEIEPPELRAEAVHRIAAGFRQLGRRAEAEAAGRRALALEEELGRTILVGNHLMFLALVLEDQGRISEALALAERALDCYIDQYGEDHREVDHVASVVAKLQRWRDES